MPEPIGMLLILLILLEIKHMFADFFLQTPKMLSGRGEYLHCGRAEHAGVHVVGTILAFLIVGAPFLVLLVIAVLEWIIHFHIDYFKARYSEARQLNPSQGHFWMAFGADQTAHQLTYVAMIWAWAAFAL